MNRTLYLFFAILLLQGCRSAQRPADVLEPATMASLLSEAYLLEGFYAVETEYRYDRLLPEVLAAYDDILARHGTTRQAVESSFAYYSQHPEQYKPIQDSAMAILERVPITNATRVDVSEADSGLAKVE